MQNQLKTVLLLGALSGLLVAIGGSLGPNAMWLFTGLALLMNIGAYFFSDKLVLRMHGAQAVTESEAPALHRMVDELAREAGLPKPRVYVIPDMQPNAFATGRNPEKGVVAVTQGIMQLLDERELRGVIAHELSHIKNRDILVATIAAGIATAVTHIASALQWGAFLGAGRSDDEEGGSPLAGLAMAIVAPIAATLIQLGISRSREYLADESAARMTRDPEGLARALEKLTLGAQRIAPAVNEPATASLFIVSPLAGGSSVMSLFSTHPAIEERVRRLRALHGGSAAASARI